MKLTPATTIAAVAVIGAGGFLIGRISSPDASGTEAGQAMEAGGLPTRSSARGGDGADGGPESRASSRGETANTRDRQATLARLESIVRGEDALERNRAMLALIDRLSPDEFEDAVAHFRSLGLTEQRFGEYAMLLSAWAKVDPTAALAYAQENTRGGFASNTILTAWAGTDPDAAIRWAEANHTGDGPNPHMAGIIRGIAATDPVRATELMTAMPRSNERGQALDAMLPHLLAKGVDETRDWISNLTDDSLRNGAMIRAAERLAEKDPRGTADWLLANPGEATQRRLDDVLSTWARTDQDAAVSYFTSLPAGEARSNALRGVVSSIAANDPTAAAEMIDRYSGDVNDRVVQNFVWHSFGNDPALAANYIGRIDNAGQRDNMYRRTLEHWLRRDPAAAQNWIQANQLPNNVQRHVDRRIDELRAAGQ